LSRRQARRKLWREKGVRSKLEDRACKILTDAGVPFAYEPEAWSYTIPERQAKYTPDLLVEGHYYEVKGHFDADDRKKMKLLHDQGFKFTMVFDKASNKIRKGSPTSYADWCDKYGIEWIEMDTFETLFGDASGRVQE
jgi:hypothetical protein